MNKDMKFGYIICGQRLKEEIDTMINEIQSACARTTNDNSREKLKAQEKILQNFKSKIEDAIADGSDTEGGEHVNE